MTLGTATYQITQFLSDYRTSNSATTLNPNSTLVKAAGGVIGCGSMMSPNYDGVYRNLLCGCDLCGAVSTGGRKGSQSRYRERPHHPQRWRRHCSPEQWQQHRHGVSCHRQRSIPILGWRSVGRRWWRRNMPPARERWCTPLLMGLSQQDASAIKAAAPIPTSLPATPWRIWPPLRSTSTPISTRADPAVSAWLVSQSPR